MIADLCWRKGSTSWVCLIDANYETVDLEDWELVCGYIQKSENGMFDRLGKALPNRLLQQSEGLAGFRKSFVFNCEALKTRQFASAAMLIESVQFLLPSTKLVFIFFNWKPRFCYDESETCCFEEVCV